jgi:hypothetical protein
LPLRLRLILGYAGELFRGPADLQPPDHRDHRPSDGADAPLPDGSD